MLDMLKIAFDVGLYYELELPSVERIGQGAHRLERIASGPIAVAALQEVCFVDGREDLCCCTLHQLFLQRWNAQGPEFSLTLGDVLSTHQSGAVALVLEPPHQVRQIAFQVLFVFLEGRSVHSRSRILAQGVEALPETVLVEQPVESAKPVLGFLRCLVGYSPQGGSPA